VCTQGLGSFGSFQMQLTQAGLLNDCVLNVVKVAKDIMMI
jgi:hypothetical protein